MITQTHEELLVCVLSEANRPLKAKDLISLFIHHRPEASIKTVRQVIHRTYLKKLIRKHKEDKSPGYYGLPQWFYNNTGLKGLKYEYKQKIYEGKPIRIQKPTGSLGRTA
jgi:predicted transcriptional regulator